MLNGMESQWGGEDHGEVAVRTEGGPQENLMVPFELTKSIISLSVAVMGEVGAQENLMTPFEITK